MVDYYRAEKLDSIANITEEQLLVSPQTATDTKVTILRNIISKSEDAGGDSTKILNIFNRLLSQKQKDTKIAEIYVAYVSLKKMPQDSLVSALNRILEIEPDNKGRE